MEHIKKPSKRDENFLGTYIAYVYEQFEYDLEFRSEQNIVYSEQQQKIVNA